MFTTGRVVHHPSGQSFWFDAGAACLEFAMTGGEGEAARFETLHTPDDLRAWLAGAPLAGDVEVTARGLAAAKGLRRAITAAAYARAAGEPLPADAVGVINASAARPPLAPVLGDDGRSARWAAPATLTRALSTLARDAVEVFTGPLADRVKVCGADNCALVFVDTSRPGSRRWCSMERCGNRHKLRTHRARQAP